MPLLRGIPRSNTKTLGLSSLTCLSASTPSSAVPLITSPCIRESKTLSCFLISAESSAITTFNCLFPFHERSPIVTGVCSQTGSATIDTRMIPLSFLFLSCCRGLYDRQPWQGILDKGFREPFVPSATALRRDEKRAPFDEGEGVKGAECLSGRRVHLNCPAGFPRVQFLSEDFQERIGKGSEIARPKSSSTCSAA
jgi:hypothetical protein